MFMRTIIPYIKNTFILINDLYRVNVLTLWNLYYVNVVTQYRKCRKIHSNMYYDVFGSEFANSSDLHHNFD